MTTLDPAPRPTMLAILDRVLRGDYVRGDALTAGRIDVPTTLLVRLGVTLGAISGVCLGTYGLFQGHAGAGAQLLASAVKVPLLFLLTLVVTFPSLYVFSALQRLPLDLGNTLRLMLLAMLVHLAVLASLGPVFAFFAASTDSYPFMKLLNVAFFAVGGVLGFVVLRAATGGSPAREAADEAGVPPLRRFARTRTSRMLRIWCVVYAVVGAQMGWLLRPFLGAPELPFAVFRPSEGSVFTDVIRSIGQLFGG